MKISFDTIVGLITAATPIISNALTSTAPIASSVMMVHEPAATAPTCTGISTIYLDFGMTQAEHCNMHYGMMGEVTPYSCDKIMACCDTTDATIIHKSLGACTRSGDPIEEPLWTPPGC